MGDVRVGRWTCDRCGTVDEVEGGDRPMHWRRLHRATWLTAPAAEMVADLCPECVASLGRWWAEPARAAEAFAADPIGVVHREARAAAERIADRLEAERDE